MDGFKTRLTQWSAPVRHSLQFRMSLVLSVVILLVAAAAGTISFLSALNEAHKLQDRILDQIADALLLQPPTKVRRLKLNEHDDDSDVLVWPLDPQQPALQLRKDDQPPLSLPSDLKKGKQTLTLGDETFRVLIHANDAGQRIAVAQEIHFRDRVAFRSALRTVMPFLVLVPILVLMVILLVRRLFRPITLLAAEIDRREEQDLHPVAEQNLLTEMRPFVRAINRLLMRVAQSMEAQRRFVADAAHELRSPMTALSLQAERLAGADLPRPAASRLAELRSGIERVRKLLNQLLTLARAQSAQAQAPVAVSLQQTLRHVLEDLMPLAQARAIDIGLEGTLDARIQVNELELSTLVKNLVDNAIRYTPRGGRVDLSVTLDPGFVTLHVADTGPGIAPEERERVFDAFYRTLGSGETGSGLGLAIVRTLATRLGAAVTLDYTDPAARKGLHVAVRFPGDSARPSPAG